MTVPPVSVLAEERLLVDLLRLGGVADEDDVAPRGSGAIRNTCSSMKKRLARSFSGSVIEAETSIRQNITAWVVGLGTRSKRL